MSNIRILAPLAALVLFGLVYFSSTRVAKNVNTHQAPNQVQSPTATQTPVDSQRANATLANHEGIERIRTAFENKESDVMVQAEGMVIRTLPDDNEGSRHQRFIVRLAEDLTVLISHNIDLAERAPVYDGTRVTFRGEYEWNDEGGVVHWTHDDPRGRREGGWLEVNNRRYR